MYALPRRRPTSKPPPSANACVRTRCSTRPPTRPPGVNPRTLLLRGHPGRVIADACNGLVDLLVTGSRYGPCSGR